MDKLPTEVLILIFQNLDSAKEAAQCSQVCTRFRNTLTTHDELIYGPTGISRHNYKCYWPCDSETWKSAAIRSVMTDLALSHYWFIEYEDIEQNIEPPIDCWSQYEQEGIKMIQAVDIIGEWERWPSSSDILYLYHHGSLIVLDLNNGEFGMADCPEKMRIQPAQNGWATAELPYLNKPHKYKCADEKGLRRTQLLRNDRLGYSDIMIDEADLSKVRIGVSAPNEVVEFTWTGNVELRYEETQLNNRYVLVFWHHRITIYEPAVDPSPIVTRSLDGLELDVGESQFLLTDSHIIALHGPSRTLYSCRLSDFLNGPEGTTIDWHTLLMFDEEYSNFDWKFVREFTTESAVILIGVAPIDYFILPSIACVIPLDKIAKPTVYCQLNDSAFWVLHKSGIISHVTRSAFEQLATLYRQLDLTGMVPIESISIL